MKRTLWKRKPKKLKRQSLKPIPKLQRECDKLYQTVGKKLMPFSIISGKPTQVIHHYFTKGLSSRLRYDLANGIPLTFAEHFAHHIKSDPTINATILKVRGEQWYQNLNSIKREPIKADRQYYEQVYQSLLKQL